jgi:hypothetical protein
MIKYIINAVIVTDNNLNIPVGLVDGSYRSSNNF